MRKKRPIPRKEEGSKLKRGKERKEPKIMHRRGCLVGLFVYAESALTFDCTCL